MWQNLQTATSLWWSRCTQRVACMISVAIHVMNSLIVLHLLTTRVTNFGFLLHIFRCVFSFYFTILFLYFTWAHVTRFHLHCDIQCTYTQQKICVLVNINHTAFYMTVIMNTGLRPMRSHCAHVNWKTRNKNQNHLLIAALNNKWNASLHINKPTRRKIASNHSLLYTFIPKRGTARIRDGECGWHH